MKPHALTDLIYTELARGPTTSLALAHRLSKEFTQWSPQWVAVRVAKYLNELARSGKVTRRRHSDGSPTIFELSKSLDSR